MSVFYTSVNDIQEQLMKETPDSVPNPTSVEYTNFVSYLKNQLIPQVSRYLENYTHRFFVPLYETRNFFNRNLSSKNSLEHYGYWLDFLNYRLHLDHDLLEVATYTSLGTAITSTEYRIVGTPGYAIDLDYDSNDLDFSNDTFSSSQDVLGWWGYYTDWSNAFTTVESISVDNSATSITVATDARDNYKFPQYVKCEDELMLVTAVAATELTVERGVRGTTAVAHAAKDLQTFTVDDNLHIAATRMCSWLYQNRTAQGNVVTITNISVILDQLPTFVKDSLDRLTKGQGV
jgi:hypothetical protein